MDKNGNVYVTGNSSIGIPSGAYNDYATVKYNTNGDLQWVSRYNGAADSVDEARDLEVDDNGNVYVTGRSLSLVTYYDYATIKYAPNGDTLWVRRYNGPANYDDRAYALALDSADNVYMTGQSQGSGTYYDYATIKYAPNGDTLWVRRYNGPANYDDRAYSLAVDSVGNVYVTGQSEGSGTDYDYATIKYALSGDSMWVRRYNGTGSSSDVAKALMVDAAGNVYVTGYSWGSGTYHDYATIKYIQFTCVDTTGDANGDGQVNFVDIVFKVDYVFKDGTAPLPLCRGDDNADGRVNLTDIVYAVNYIVKGGPKPVKSRECCL